MGEYPTACATYGKPVVEHFEEENPMDALEAITKRRVQRAFDSRPVDPDALAQIVDAGRHAMSARNLQPWRFIVVESRERLRQIGSLSSTGRFVADAPAAIVVLKEVANERWADIDCAQAVQNMANAAWALGLGTCWVGNFDAAKIGEILGVPRDWAIFTILPFGYPDPKNPPQARPLKPREEQVFHERYGVV
jgi:nitroreductase